MIVINMKEKVLVNKANGDIVRPNCWNDLVPYHAYLVGRGHAASAQSMLVRIFEGEKVITKMIACSQKHHDKSSNCVC